MAWFSGLVKSKLATGISPAEMSAIVLLIPVASFDITKPENQAICFNYINTQPLWDPYRPGSPNTNTHQADQSGKGPAQMSAYCPAAGSCTAFELPHSHSHLAPRHCVSPAAIDDDIDLPDNKENFQALAESPNAGYQVTWVRVLLKH